MLKALYLIRHGVTDWNQQGKAQGHADIPLNDLGRAQAGRLAERMAPIPIQALYASDLSRAAETARILGERIGQSPRFDAAWREVDIGDHEGGRVRDLPDGHESFMACIAAGHDSFGGETFAQVEARVAQGYARIQKDHPGETVAVVSHGGIFQALVVHLLGLPPEKVTRFSFRGNTGVTLFEIRNGKPRLILLNDASHADDLS